MPVAIDIMKRTPGERIGRASPHRTCRRCRSALRPRMVRYLEEQGVIAAERGPGPRGHRHYPPPEMHLAGPPPRPWMRGIQRRRLRALEHLWPDPARPRCPPSDNPLAWFELLALGRAVEIRATDRRTGTELPPQPARSKVHRVRSSSHGRGSPGRSASIRTSGHCWSSRRLVGGAAVGAVLMATPLLSVPFGRLSSPFALLITLPTCRQRLKHSACRTCWRGQVFEHRWPGADPGHALPLAAHARRPHPRCRRGRWVVRGDGGGR